MSTVDYAGRLPGNAPGRTGGRAPALRRPVITAGNLRDFLAPVLVFLFIVLNNTFMQMGIPAGGKIIPFGELFLLFSLLTISLPGVLPRLFKALGTAGAAGLSVFWIVALGQLVVSVPRDGLWALRDATNAIESLYLVVGFVFAGSLVNMNRLLRHLPAAGMVMFVYALLYPLNDFLNGILPELTTAAGYSLEILQMQNSAWVMVLGAMMAINDRRRFGYLGYLMAVLAVGYVLVFFQARTAYGQIAAGVCLMLWYAGRRWKIELIKLMALGTAALVAAVSVGPFLTGRLGESFSIEFLMEHVKSSTGSQNLSSAGTGEASSGILLRLVWWADIVSQWLSSWKNFFVGRGYGFPLVDFVAIGAGYDETGQLVREPHNSFMSTLARLGLAGLAGFFAFQSALLWRTMKAVRRLRGNETLRRFAFICLCFFIFVLLAALAEDALEKPYDTIPYYFLGGVMLRLSSHLDSLQTGAGRTDGTGKPCES